MHKKAAINSVSTRTVRPSYRAKRASGSYSVKSRLAPAIENTAPESTGYSAERETRVSYSFNPQVETLERDFRYTLSPLKSYNPDRHITPEEAEVMVKEAGLRPAKLRDVVGAGDIKVYEIEGKKFLDRLDIGRVYHRAPAQHAGMTIDRYFSKPQENPLDAQPERYTDVKIADKDGKTIFSMPQVEVPKGWDEGDLVIVAQKYFMKPSREEWKEKLKEKLGRDHEFSPRHLINRVTNFVTDSGWKLGYFASEQDRENFRAELAKLQIDRKFAFNSPVQFNAGVFSEYGIEGSDGISYIRDPKTGKVRRLKGGSYVRPQAHACFIKGPSDDLESILQHVLDEGAVFSSGSGIGQNIGLLREEGAKLSGGGKASGPMSFFKIYDVAAGSIKSGGKSRRAARMTVMDQEHPDIMFFVQDKLDADEKCLDLMKAGWTGGMDGEAATTVQYQNTNISVRVSADFFRKAQTGGKVQLRSAKDGKVVREIDAGELLKHISFGSWRIGDPAIQYRDQIDKMHTAKNSGKIWSSNPCSEYLFLNDTSCNLASTNLAMFADDKGEFDVESFTKANRLIAMGCDILNDAASYPIKTIAQISPEFRTIGVGYAGLGNLLMRKGIPYNSDEGRALAGAITALMTGTVYETSAELAAKVGTFPQFELNKKPMLRVMQEHKKSLDDRIVNNEAAARIKGSDKKIVHAAETAWNNVLKNGSAYGFRNAQATVLAPTGTISYLMGCSDSTGVEPGYQLQIWKNLAGGGGITITSREIPNALKNLGYREEQIKVILGHIDKNNTVVGAPYIRPEHLSVFETAAGNDDGLGSMSFEGHVKMLGATQPFISGAISKTCNLPENTSVRQVYDNYILGNDLGLKALAMFRKNSKPTTALGKSAIKRDLKRGEKEELPTRRNSYEFEVKIGNTPVHMIVGEYPDGRPGQITFLSYKAGSTLGAALRSAGIQASAALKRGVRLEDVIKGWIGEQFEPNGIVSGHPHIKTALSPLDLAGKLLALEYLGDTEIASTSHDGSGPKIDLTKLRGFENGAFNTLIKNSVNEWDYEQVINDPRLGGFKKAVEGSLTALMQTATKDINNKVNGSDRGLPCPACGCSMRQTAPGCFKCDHCGDKVGGCGM